MNRVLLLGIDGLDKLADSQDRDACPAFCRLMNGASSGKLAGTVPLSGDLAWSQVLSGINGRQSCPETYLTKLLPRSGVSIRMDAVSGEESSLKPADILSKEQDCLKNAVAKKPVDMMDVHIIRLEGYHDYCASGGNGSDYWSGVDAELGVLLDSLPENTIVILFAPDKQVTSNKGILINKWLCDNGFLKTRDASVDEGESDCWYDASVKGLKLSSGIGADRTAELLDKLRALKIYARRGGDLKVFEFEELYTDKKQADDADIYLVPKNPDVYLSDALADSAEAVYTCGEATVTRVPEGILYISGFHVEAEKELVKMSLLSIAPTIVDILELKPYWKMQGHSFKRQFTKLEIKEGASVADDAMGNAVKSRLLALGY